ncbi:MAG: hypothetical protein KF819_03425 [Labilithrix sp.]|nr:hypothetical protein [Labilithrix sp.]
MGSLSSRIASLAAAAVVAGAVVNCSDERSVAPPDDGASTNAALQACSPLEGKSTPIALESVLAVGRHADGTIYVVDGPMTTARVFVTERGALRRKNVAGSSSMGPSDLSLRVDDAADPFTLRLDLSGGATRMGIFRGALTNAKTFEIGVDGDVLEIVGQGEIAGLPVENLPARMNLQAHGVTADGRHVLATLPDVDPTADDYRLFYGPADRVVERPITSVSPGGSLNVAFLLDGREASARFAFTSTDPRWSVTTDRGQELLTPVTEPVDGGVDAAIGGAAIGRASLGAEPLSFFCLR